MIAQTRLKKLLTLQRMIEKLTKNLDSIKLSYSSDAEEIINALTNGESVERGALLVAVNTTLRRVVSWRGVVEEKLGKDEAERILNETPPHVSRRLVISRTPTSHGRPGH